MAKEVFLIGMAGVILGIGIFVKTHTILPALVPTLIGIGLMFFYKEEDKIENRKDAPTKGANRTVIKTKKTKN
ncbi:MAG: hypothetical protein ABIF18_01895 [archaeon]